jgi:hypothetical protein
MLTEQNGCRLVIALALLSAMIAASPVSDVSAQTATNPTPGAATAKIGVASENGKPTGELKPLKSATRDKAKLSAYNNAGWSWLINSDYCKDTQSNACANHALVLAGTICSSSALVFQKKTRDWQAAQLILVLASAGFTGAGSAATLAGSSTVPKVFSTLGGTTGLGAVTATTNTNISDYQAGVAAVNQIQAEIQKLDTPTKDDSDTNQKILVQAEGYANQCVAANPLGSTNTGKGSTPAAPAPAAPAPAAPAPAVPAPAPAAPAPPA